MYVCHKSNKQFIINRDLIKLRKHNSKAKQTSLFTSAASLLEGLVLDTNV